MIDPQFRLRELDPADSSALAKLITEFDGDLTTRFQVDPYKAIVSGTEFPTVGVVAEADGHNGFVGMGTVRFGQVHFNGEILPFAFLDGLKVNKDFRGHGLGYELARWRVERARKTIGDRCVIVTGMLYDNYASHAVASKWCREFAESALYILIMPTRSSPPKPVSGITVRELRAEEHEEYAVKHNRFHQKYNLSAPVDPESIANALHVSVDGRKPYRYYAALDGQRNLLAGAQTWARGLLKADTINQPPAPLRMMNKLLHLVPEDFTIRDINVGGLWHEPGHSNAAKYLWESIRWLDRDRGTTITAGFDARDPLRQVPDLKPWHQPRPQITLAIHGPAPIDRSKLFFSLGRV